MSNSLPTEAEVKIVDVSKYVDLPEAEVTNVVVNEIIKSSNGIELLKELAKYRKDIVAKALQEVANPTLKAEIAELLFSEMSKNDEFADAYNNVIKHIPASLEGYISGLKSDVNPLITIISNDFKTLKADKDAGNKIEKPQLDGVMGNIHLLANKIEELLSNYKSTITDYITSLQISDIEKKVMLGVVETNPNYYKTLEMLNHIFRTPLTIVQTNGSLMTSYFDRLAPEKFNEKLNNATPYLDELIEIIDSLDEFNTIYKEAPLENQVQVTIADINSSIDDLIKQIYLPDSVSQNFSIQLNNQLTSDLLTSINLQQVLTALEHIIDNSVSFGNPDHTTIDITLKQLDNFIVIEVTDNGEGINEGALVEVTEPFRSQIDKEVSGLSSGKTFIGRRGTGLGLGLYKARKLIEDNNGFINIESTVGVGTTVSIALPIEK